MPVQQMADTARAIVAAAAAASSDGNDAEPAEPADGAAEGEADDAAAAAADDAAVWDSIVETAAAQPKGYVTTAHRVLVRARDDAFNSFLEYYQSSVAEVGEVYDGLLLQETIWEEKWAGMVAALVKEDQG